MMGKCSGICSVSITLSSPSRCVLIEDILGEINAEAFTGDLPSKKQSDHARQQNCEHSNPETI